MCVPCYRIMALSNPTCTDHHCHTQLSVLSSRASITALHLVSSSAHPFLAAPSGTPNEVEAFPQGPNSIHLSWGAPDFIRQNGPITGYDVMYSGGGISRTISYNNSTTVFILNGLQPYTAYSISVAAINSQGQGPFSAAIEQTTLEARETVIVSLLCIGVKM